MATLAKFISADKAVNLHPPQSRAEQRIPHSGKPKKRQAVPTDETGAAKKSKTSVAKTAAAAQVDSTKKPSKADEVISKKRKAVPQDDIMDAAPSGTSKKNKAVDEVDDDDSTNH